MSLISRSLVPHGLSVAAAVVALCSSTSVSAQSLMALYQEAMNYDAVYLAAKAQAESVGYKAEQAKALRRPMVNLKGNMARQRFNPASLNLSQAEATLAAQQGYTGKSSSITAKTLSLEGKQTLFNAGVNATVAQADQSLVVAQADLETAEDDLLVRLTQAYFDVLAAKDVLATTQANKSALSEQLASAKRNFEVGNATITDTREAQARFDLATAQEIAAQNELRVRGIALDQLVGRANVVPQPLLTPVNLPALAPEDVEQWVSLTDNSPQVRKAKAGLEVAKLETTKARAEHYPTVDLLASVKKNKIDAASVLQETSSGTTSVVAVEVNVPIFAGFSTQNKISEALSLEEKSARTLENAQRSVALGTRQAFFGVQSGMAQVRALEAAEASAKLALEATQLGYKVGVRVNKDVLDAQTALSNTQKDLYKARYDTLVGMMKLRQVSGTLQAEDLGLLNQLTQEGQTKPVPSSAISTELSPKRSKR